MIPAQQHTASHRISFHHSTARLASTSFTPPPFIYPAEKGLAFASELLGRSRPNSIRPVDQRTTSPHRHRDVDVHTDTATQLPIRAISPTPHSGAPPQPTSARRRLTRRDKHARRISPRPASYHLLSTPFPSPSPTPPAPIARGRISDQQSNSTSGRAPVWPLGLRPPHTLYPLHTHSFRAHQLVPPTARA